MEAETGATGGRRSPQQAAEPVASGPALTELQRALQQVCEQAGWPYAEAWSPRPDGTCTLLPPWHRDDHHRLEPFRRPTEQLGFMPEFGLPGRVLASKQAIFVADVTTDPLFCRPTAARKAGLVGAVGVPVLAGGTVVAVLVFFGRADEVSAWPRVAELARAATRQFGPSTNETPPRPRQG
jgi:rsbT co-antagonist protein RsbR